MASEVWEICSIMNCSVRNSLPLLGVAVSTHRASERVRGSEHGTAGRGTVWLCLAMLGKHAADWRQSAEVCADKRGEARLGDA